MNHVEHEADEVFVGEVHEAGGVLTFFIPAKNAGDF